MTTCQSADLRVYVELRGFEPLTPSMRTERAPRQSRCYTTFLHVRSIEPGTLTASDRALRRPAAPMLLPESDTVADCERTTGRAAPTVGELRTGRSASAVLQ